MAMQTALGWAWETVFALRMGWPDLSAAAAAVQTLAADLQRSIDRMPIRLLAKKVYQIHWYLLVQSADQMLILVLVVTVYQTRWRLLEQRVAQRETRSGLD
jgi:hypothetical protein